MKKFLFFLALLGSTAIHGQLSSDNFDIMVLRGAQNFTKVWDDKGSGAIQDVSIWRPKAPSGYYILGDIALSQHNPDGIKELYALVVKPKQASYIAIAGQGASVWDDSGSDADKDIKLYRLKCPSGYVALGIVGNSMPGNCACIKESEAAKGGWDESENPKDPRASKAYWTDKGSGADDDVSFWKTISTQNSLSRGELGLSPNTFFATQYHDKTPQVDNVQPYVLKVRFPLDQVSIFNKLQGQYIAPKPYYNNQGDLITPNSSTIDYKVPFFLVPNDPAYSSQLEQMEKSPIYLIKRTSKYKILKQLNNTGSQINSLSVGQSETVSKGKNYAHSAGVAVGLSVTAGGKAGVPLVAEGEVSITASVTASYNYSWGGSETESTEISSGAQINIQPGCRGAILEVVNNYDVFRIVNGQTIKVDIASFSSARTGSTESSYFQIDWCPGGGRSIPPTNTQSIKRTTLNPGESLMTNEQLYSSNGSYYLKMQDDGHLCIYTTANNRFVWGSGVYKYSGANGATLKFQTDGNLVVYDKSNVAKWSSKTHPFYDPKFKDTKNLPVKMVLGDDGVLKLNTASGSVVWSSK